MDHKTPPDIQPAPEAMRIVRRIPVSFDALLAPGETRRLRPLNRPPALYVADRLHVPPAHPAQLLMTEVCYQAPVSITVLNAGTQPATFQATMMGNDPRPRAERAPSAT